MSRVAGALVVDFGGGRDDAPCGWVTGPAGGEEQGIGTGGFPRNVGDPVVSKENPGRRYRVNNSRPARRHSALRERNPSATLVPAA